MELTGTIRVSDDEDFAKLWELVDADDIWKLDYEQDEIKVWSKHSHNSDLKMVKVCSVYRDVDVATLFDVLMDAEYRPLWDAHMIESYTIGYLNPNNDVGYYAMSCPPPIQNRDFVLQRSWLVTPQRLSIFNHSVCLRSHPPKKYFVRGISYITGYVIEPLATSSGNGVRGCSLAYVSLTDPKGAIPLWAINKSTQYFAPKNAPARKSGFVLDRHFGPWVAVCNFVTVANESDSSGRTVTSDSTGPRPSHNKQELHSFQMIKTLHQACLGYNQWKSQHSPGYKPWIYPEQIDLPKLTIDQCIANSEVDKAQWKGKKPQEKIAL